MQTEWKSAGIPPREISGAVVQTIRSTVTNESGHEIVVDGRTVVVLPDGATRAKKRSWTITDALDAGRWIQEYLDEIAVKVGSDDAVPTFDRVAYLVGRLVTIGATRIEIDGEPITPTGGDSTVQWVVELNGDGSLHARHLG